MSSPIVTGSVAAVAGRNGQSIAQAFLGVERLVLIDCSGSMNYPDSHGGRRRIDVARQELAKLQAEFPGKLAVIAWSDVVQFMPGGSTPEPAGGTDLTGALHHAKRYDGLGLRLVVISDGVPNDREGALKIAKTYTSHIDCIFVGPETDAEAALFLRRLAGMSSGRYGTAEKAFALADALRPMLTADNGGGDQHAAHS